MGEEVDTVEVTAADFNGRDWDGSPFEPVPVPQWIIAAVAAGKITPDCPGSTDYAVWDVSTPGGKVVAEPGDKIVRNVDGSFTVTRWTRP